MEEAGITIVVPAFRAARTLRQAVESAARAARVIVVFDGPDAAAESAIADLPVETVRLGGGSGAPACRNAGLALAVSPYVLFLDADDYLEGPLLPAACRIADEAPADLVLAPFAFEYPDGSRQVCDPRLRYREASVETVLRAWLAELYTPPCAVVWRRDFLQAIGGWDEGIAKNQDGDLIYRALARRPRLAFSTAGLGVYVQGDNPGRVSRRQDERALASQLRVLDRVRDMAAEQDFAVGAELARAYYTLARWAYTQQADEIGAMAERAARELGQGGEVGSVTHRALAAILGLRGKQRLARFARAAAALGAAMKERVWPIPHSSASTGAPPPSAPISPTATAARSIRSRAARARSG
jgi:hypothetical protein